MEQTIIDFFAKSSELILRNRLLISQYPYDIAVGNFLTPNTRKFQLSFERKVNFTTHLPSEWKDQTGKLLVIELFVCPKTTTERFLAEQWVFEISSGTHEKLDDTIDSPNTLYKRLSILLRTISLLTVTLPLYQKVIRERDSSSLSRSCIIEYSVSYSKDILSTWPSNTWEDNNLGDYSSSDFVLPGRTFSFKVSYSKSLRFLEKICNCEQGEVDQLAQMKQVSFVRRAFSDNHYNKDIRILNYVFPNDSPPEINQFDDKEDQYCTSQRGSAPVRQRLSSVTDNKQSTPRVWDMAKILDASKLRIKTLESEGFGEGDIFVCENDEEKFTEILSWKDISMRNQSPTRITFQQRDADGSSGIPMLRKMSEDYERNRMRMSVNVKPIEKILEQTHDDHVAELLNSIEDLKALTKRQDFSSRVEQEKIEKKEDVNKRGLRFENVLGSKRELSEDMLNPFPDMSELRDLYFKIKGSGTTR